MPFIHSQRSLPVLGGFGFWGGVSSLLSKAGAESLPCGALKFGHEWNHRVATPSCFGERGGVSSLMSKAEAGSLPCCALNLGMGGSYRVAMPFFLYFGWGK